MREFILAVAWATGLAIAQWAVAADAIPGGTRGDALLRDYFDREVRAIESGGVGETQSPERWQARRGEYRRELAEMLGLWPEPTRTDLKATITGRARHAEFTVERLTFQSVP